MIVTHINQYLLSNKKKIRNNRVNLLYWSPNSIYENIGDYLSKVIVEKMLDLNNISLNSKVDRTKILVGIGSLLHKVTNNATVWGTGINGMIPFDLGEKIENIDIRLVRGPVTRKFLIDNNFDCPENYGDPGLALSKLYPMDTVSVNKKRKYLFIPNLFDIQKFSTKNFPFDILSPLTKNWRNFINRIIESECVISTSLHGIVLSESYGVPAVYLDLNSNNGSKIKFDDYYHGTKRKKYNFVSRLDENIDMKKNDLPFIDDNILASFPYDLWV